MAITKEIKLNKIEVVGSIKSIQLQYVTIIKEDEVEISQSNTRRAFDCGRLDNENNFIDTDISGETADVQAICNQVWTDAVKAEYKKKLIEIKSQ